MGFLASVLGRVKRVFVGAEPDFSTELEDLPPTPPEPEPVGPPAYVAPAEPIFDEENIRAVQVVEVLKQCYDPEIPASVFDLGLIYRIDADAGEVRIRMTFTSRSCPAAQQIPDDIRAKVQSQMNLAPEGVTIDVVFEPPWSPSMINAEARELLGIG